VGQSVALDGTQVLEHAIAAAGGRNAWNDLTDFRAIGNFSLYSHQAITDSGNATLLGAGLKKFRLTATLEHETRIWV